MCSWRRTQDISRLDSHVHLPLVYERQSLNADRRVRVHELMGIYCEVHYPVLHSVVICSYCELSATYVKDPRACQYPLFIEDGVRRRGAASFSPQPISQFGVKLFLQAAYVALNE